MKVKQILFTGMRQVEFGEDEFQPPFGFYRDDLFLTTEYTLISPGTGMDCLRGRAAAVFDWRSI